jgi:rod shape-determining protein MreC
MAIGVKPTANLSRLEEVLVITGTSGSLPPDAQADASTAEGINEANKRAADLIAEKLPSLHDDAPENAAGAVPNGTATAPGQKPDSVPGLVGGVPGIPNSGLPRPKPAVHPDRYSPGTVPSAADLKPGARPDGSTPPQPATPPKSNQTNQQE